MCDGRLLTIRYVTSSIPGARLYESRQLFNHDFMLCELDKLLRMLLDDGLGLDLPCGASPSSVNRVVRLGAKSYQDLEGRCAMANRLCT